MQFRRVNLVSIGPRLYFCKLRSYKELVTLHNSHHNHTNNTINSITVTTHTITTVTNLRLNTSPLRWSFGAIRRTNTSISFCASELGLPQSHRKRNSSANIVFNLRRLLIHSFFSHTPMFLSFAGVRMYPQIWRQKCPPAKKYWLLKKYSPLKKISTPESGFYLAAPLQLCRAWL